jgi:hypothetical protein
MDSLPDRELAEWLLGGTAIGRAKVAFMGLLLLTGALAGREAIARPPVASQVELPKAAKAEATERPKSEKQLATRTDRYGDPLPEGAIARIGTTRFRDSSNVYSVCYSPDGKILASIGSAGVRMWNAVTGKELQNYDRSVSQKEESFPPAGYTRGFFSPDGRRLWLQSSGAWQNSPGQEIYFLEVNSGFRPAVRKAPFDGKDLYLLAPSPDGKFLAISDKSSIRICKTATEGTESVSR